MTLSIVARDPETGLLGCAVTSCAVAAGRRILHARPGVGVSVAQASSMLCWGDELLDAVARGVDPREAIDSLARADNQLAVVDVTGRIAVHTGGDCLPYAGDAQGEMATAQVNCAALPDAADRMLAAYEASELGFTERLVAALAASGGDIRGQQGAAVIVTTGTVRDDLAGFWHEPHVDLRVDDHRSPVDELARLLSLHRAHNEMRRLGDSDPAEQVTLLEELVRPHSDDPHLNRALDRARRAHQESR